MSEEIETKRLFLREITENDADQIVKWRSDPSVYCYFYNPHKINIEEHLNWYRRCYLADDNRLEFMAIEKTSKAGIGVFGIARREKSTEVSYLLDKKFQGKGYASEAVKGLMKYAEEKWQSLYVTAGIHESNFASIRLVEKLGFQKKEKQGSFLIYQKEL